MYTGVMKPSFHFPELESRTSDSVKWRFLGVAGRLTKLVVDGSWWNQDFAELLPTFHALNHLHLRPGPLPALPSTPSFRLVQFSASLHAEQQQVVHQFLSSSHATPSDLQLSAQGILSAEAALDLSPFVALRLLVISSHYNLDDKRSLSGIESLAKTLTPSVEKFGIVYDNEDVETAPPDLEELDFLRILPSSLHHLALSSTPFSTTYHLGALADSACLPSTETICLDNRLWSAEDEEYLDRPEEELQAVSALAQRRSVELRWPRTEEVSEEEEGDDTQDGEDGSDSSSEDE